jgi:hypothetical protein
MAWDSVSPAAGPRTRQNPAFGDAYFDATAFARRFSAGEFDGNLNDELDRLSDDQLLALLRVVDRKSHC